MQKLERVSNKNSVKRLIVFMSLLVVFVFFACLCVGRYNIPLPKVVKIIFSRIFTDGVTDWSPTDEAIVWDLRVPRAIMAMLVGSSLALSGSAYQGIFKNPLVSPDLLGVSAGACVGASIGILCSFNSLGIQVLALVGGLLAVTLTTTLPKLFKNNSTMMLVLSGIITGGFMSAIIGLLKFVADTDEKLAEMTYWMMGSLANTTIKDVAGIVIPVIACSIILISLRFRINLLSLGDVQARSLGVNVKKTRGIIVLCSTLITASVVSVSGTIGWVGLVIPHFSRMLVGHDNKKSLPVALLMGGTFMMVVDTLARSISSSDIPISIVTSFLGAPLYAWLLYRQEVRVK